MSEKTYIEVNNLVKYFPVTQRKVIGSSITGWVRACDGVNFKIKKGETLGVVGESGCGKTTAAKCILYLIEPTDGQVLLEGEDIFETFKSKNRENILNLRSKMQLVYQNPYGSLNPRWTVYNLIAEPFTIHKKIPKEEWQERVFELLGLVSMENYHAERYPHEFSGGQRQRICIARALAVEPEFLVLDEPVSSLDVSVRAQILNLLQDLQERLNLTYLYISHDLASIKHICDRVIVMYLGRVMEVATADALFESPLHPYTQALLSAIPVADPNADFSRIVLEGEVPSPINLPEGCRFYPRCSHANLNCREKEPELREIEDGHFIACYLE
jgi:oligopeptide/dipeptide ABC transporter ATP-binding protein